MTPEKKEVGKKSLRECRKDMYLLLTESLHSIPAFPDMIAVCKEALKPKIHPNDANILQYSSSLKNGTLSM